MARWRFARSWLCWIPGRMFLGLVIFTAGVVLSLMIMVHHDMSRQYTLVMRQEAVRKAFWDMEMDSNYSLAREKHLNACAEIRHVRQIDYRQTNRQIFISRKYNFAVCVVPKAGCTFMKQLVYYLNDPQDWNKSSFLQMQSKNDFINKIKDVQNRVFDIPRKEIHHTLHFSAIHISLEEFIASEGLKVVHTRNPYSRLYSAYIDKFYIPMMWDTQVYTYKTKLMSKKNYIPKYINSCFAKFETFEDFLETVILMAENGWLDVHWGPISALCSPCRVQPDIVIRQENYYADVQYLLKKLNVGDPQLQTINNAIAKQGIQTDVYLYGLIKTMFNRGMAGPRGECFSKVEIAQRVFQALKIQGQVYESVPFPTEKFYKTPHFDEDFVAKEILAAMKQMPITGEESRVKRQRALARAYRSIRPEIIIQIQGLYYHDFMMFGYDFSPPSVN